MGITIRPVDDLEGCRAVDALFCAIWGLPASAQFVPPPLLLVMAHAGNYLVAAHDNDRLVGASMGFLGMEGTAPILHSHITGLVPEAQGRALGFALKQHQREWCLARGIRTIEWTFDPLVRRNGYFNLQKLGATVTAYYANYYGPMTDGINQGDESDRCLVRWELERTEPRPNSVQAEAAIVLAEEDGRPAHHLVAHDGAPLLVYVPEDILAVRQADPASAKQWRVAVREAMGDAIAGGYAATAMTKDGAYVLTPHEGATHS